MWFEVDGQVFEIDECDVHLIVGQRCYLSDGYVCVQPTYKRKCPCCGQDVSEGKKRSSLLHLIISDAPKGITTHHKDENKLNNRRHNLELLTRSEHMKRHNEQRNRS